MPTGATFTGMAEMNLLCHMDNTQVLKNISDTTEELGGAVFQVPSNGKKYKNIRYWF